MQLPTFEREEKLVEQGKLPVGIDEAGRGPLAGPVVACATLYKKIEDRRLRVETDEEEKRWKLVRDSKKLSPKQRDEAYAFVREQFYIGVGIIGPETIDRVNILGATFLAMRAALTDLQQTTNNFQQERRRQEVSVIPAKAGIQVSSDALDPWAKPEDDKQWVILIDGNQVIPNISLEQEAIVNGDGLVRSIAAASIIAKVTRDRLIVEADQLYPGYGLAEHKGYGTAVHMAALRKLGPSPIHRMSFRPVQLAIPENVNKRFASVLKPKRK